MQGVLEYAAGSQAENVGSVVVEPAAHAADHLGDLPELVGKEHGGAANRQPLGFDPLQLVGKALQVHGGIVLAVTWHLGDVQAVSARVADALVGVVSAVLGR